MHKSRKADSVKKSKYKKKEKQISLYLFVLGPRPVGSVSVSQHLGKIPVLVASLL